MYYLLSFIFFCLSVYTIILCVKLEKSTESREIKDPYGSVSSMLSVVAFLCITLTLLSIVYPKMHDSFYKKEPTELNFHNKK